MQKVSKAEPLWDGSSNMNPAGLSFWSLVREDFVTHDRDMFSQGFFALFVHRFGNWRMSVKYKVLRMPFSLLYHVLAKVVQVFCGIKLDYTVLVGRRVKLEHFGGMILGARRIGDDVVIGSGAQIIGPIQIGKYARIAANAVVVKNVPESATMVGIPAKAVRLENKGKFRPYGVDDKVKD